MVMATRLLRASSLLVFCHMCGDSGSRVLGNKGRGQTECHEECCNWVVLVVGIMGPTKL